ncbi:MAG TPA: response regulator [Prolixibacteraceae bacterium]|nr:response regulator [Prolixibacteraceae bacterium]
MDNKNRKVLLVEDQQKVAEAIKNELIAQEFMVTVSTSVEKGIFRAMAYPFDLFVVNCGDDGRDGFTFANNLKKEAGYSTFPILFTLNPKAKVDVRLRKFNQPFDILRLPLDGNEIKIRISRLLDMKPPVEEASGERKTSESGSKPAGKILLVEDNALNQKVLGMFISKLGYEYDVAGNGQAAVDLSEKTNYPFILMDIYMPGMDGPEATVKIREQEQGGAHRAKIIAITANESEESVKRCYDSGMDDYLVKPFTLDVLKEKLV